jgi:pimeloyl-ACP methyl ester carboxylesterase
VEQERAHTVAVTVPDGTLHGWRDGHGPHTAVCFHGGPGLGDLTGPLAELLGDVFTSVRYQQRGQPPTTIQRPYTVEANVADALAVIDQAAGGHAWIVGFSWGGYLGLEVLAASPERVQGAILIDPLGAFSSAIDEFGEHLTANVPPRLADRLVELAGRSDRGETTAAEDVELDRIVWRCYFADPERAVPMPAWRANGECFNETVTSIRERDRLGTLRDALAALPTDLPVLFVHGARGPMPLWSSTDTAALMPNARVEVIEDAGHFLFYEQPERLRAVVTGFVEAAGRRS